MERDGRCDIVGERAGPGACFRRRAMSPQVSVDLPPPPRPFTRDLAPVACGRCSYFVVVKGSVEGVILTGLCGEGHGDGSGGEVTTG